MSEVTAVKVLGWIAGMILAVGAILIFKGIAYFHLRYVEMRNAHADLEKKKSELQRQIVAMEANITEIEKMKAEMNMVRDRLMQMGRSQKEALH